MAGALAMQHLRSRHGCGCSRLGAAARLRSQEGSRDPYHQIFSVSCVKKLSASVTAAFFFHFSMHDIKRNPL